MQKSNTNGCNTNNKMFVHSQNAHNLSQMSQAIKRGIAFILALRDVMLRSILLVSTTALIAGCNSDYFLLLHPKGEIALQERNIIIVAVILMLIVVLPVIVMTFLFAWRYRANNKSAKYTPEWEHSAALEAVWWFIPCVIIAILGTITWTTSHTLDPYKPLESKVKPVTVQVIALDWKWLFIYPNEQIATINYLQLPAATPINFLITSDAPMNSFWIPSLGGQIYAMAGMQTKLHLIAWENGVYEGGSASFSGAGFSWMNFKVKTTSRQEFNDWVRYIKDTYKEPLDLARYNQLAKPSQNVPPQFFSTIEPGLYKYEVMKYMMPMSGPSEVANDDSEAINMDMNDMNSSMNHNATTSMPSMQSEMQNMHNAGTVSAQDLSQRKRTENMKSINNVKDNQ